MKPTGLRSPIDIRAILALRFAQPHEPDQRVQPGLAGLVVVEFEGYGDAIFEDALTPATELKELLVILQNDVLDVVLAAKNGSPAERLVDRETGSVAAAIGLCDPG